VILRWIDIYWVDVIGAAFYLASLPFLLSVARDAYRVWRNGGGRMALGLMFSTVSQALLLIYLMLVVGTHYDLTIYSPIIRGEVALFVRPMAFVSAAAIWWALRTDRVAK
jgi:hypothetical protein